MIEKELQNLGLSEKETKIYMAALESRLSCKANIDIAVCQRQSCPIAAW